MNETAAYIVAAIAMSASLLIWWKIVQLARANRPVVSAQPRRDVPWRGRHVAVAFFVYVVLPSIALLAVRWYFEIPPDQPVPDDNVEILVINLASMSLLSLVAAGLVVTFLKLDLAATAEDLGWKGGHAARDIGLGLLAFVAVGPMVYALQNVLTELREYVSGEKTVHPLVELVLENPTEQVLLWTFVSAVLVAPIVEEFLFRVVFQGWLEKLVRIARATIESRNNASGQQNNDSSGTGGDVAVEAPVVSIPEPVMMSPLVISSFAFSFFHIGQGTAPVPLFFLAMVLGYLYQRTHRILPCLVLHMTLNAFSMIALWLMLPGSE